MPRVIAVIVLILLSAAHSTGTCPHPVVPPSSSSAHPPTGQNQIPEVERISWLARHYGRSAAEAQEVASAILYHSRELGLDPYLVAAVMAIESSFNPSARSRAGARGRMQLMPATARAFGGYDIRAGCRYLAYLTSRFGSREEVLAAYDAGPTRIRRIRQIARWPRETREYVRLVTDLYQYLVNPRDNVYIVRPGDTLWDIAQHYKIAVKDLVQLNMLCNPNFIRSGQILRIRGDEKMKREILCPSCAKHLRRMFPNENPYPNEYVKFQSGIAKSDFYCDNCNTQIKSGSPCTCFTIYLAGQYIPWEQNFIGVGEEKE